MSSLSICGITDSNSMQAQSSIFSAPSDFASLSASIRIAGSVSHCEEFSSLPVSADGADTFKRKTYLSSCSWDGSVIPSYTSASSYSPATTYLSPTNTPPSFPRIHLPTVALSKSRIDSAESFSISGCKSFSITNCPSCASFDTAESTETLSNP